VASLTIKLGSYNFETMKLVILSISSLMGSRHESESLTKPRTLIAAFLSKAFYDKPNFSTYFIMIGYTILLGTSQEKL
jgi:hypothetical protein